MGNFFIRSSVGSICLIAITIVLSFSFFKHLLKKMGFIETLLLHTGLALLLFIGSVNLTLPGLLKVQSHLSPKHIELVTLSNITLKKIKPLTLCIYTATTSNGDTMYILDSNFEKKLNSKTKSSYLGEISYCKTFLGNSITMFDPLH